jgi:predicted  nucleic acid-binding Zn-ribbon protein
MSKAKWTWLAPLLLAAYAAAYVSWIPPHAVLTQAYPMNATHFTAYVNNAAVYITQASLSFHGSPAEAQAVMQYLYSQCRYVAVDVLNAAQISETEQLWTADIYCSPDGSMWLWLRWLPLRFTAYSGYVEYVNATNATVTTPVGTFTNHIPAGWYLDPLTKAVFKIPEANLTLLSYAAGLSEQLKALKAELNKSRADANQTASLIAKLEAQIARLETQRRALEEALRQRESEAAALQANLRAAQAENERLKTQLAQLKAENDQLKAKLASMNQTIAGLNNQLTSLKTQLAVQMSGGEEGPNPLMYILPAALAGVAAAFVIYRKKKAEE